MSKSFDFKKKLGAGNFGEVWLVTDMGLAADCALKCIPTEKIINQDNFFQEAQVLKVAEHPNIVEVKETNMLDDGRVYVAMEYLKKGSLEDEASGAYVSMKRARKIMIDVLRGLEYAHSKGIIHRDVKPANILIGDSEEGKLSDFGLALPDPSKLNLSAVKQYEYLTHLAPEVSKFEEYTFLSDVYACGVTLYRLVNGDIYLPMLTSPEVIRERTLAGTFPNRTKYRKFVPRQFRSVINKAMSIDPSRRYQSAEEFRRALERIKIFAHWNEEKLQNGMVWTAKYKEMTYRVERVQGEDKKWKVFLYKGSKKSLLKRVHKCCSEGLSKGGSDKASRDILQKFVNGKV